MKYSIKAEIWKSVFAVPSEIVDKHMKLAGAAQLKVILWFLRHSYEEFEIEDIAQALSMQSADVRDSLQYWVETGVININKTDTVSVKKQNISETKETEDKNNVLDIQQNELKTTRFKKGVSHPQKPSMQYIAQRIEEDESIQYLMESVDNIFGRITSTNDKATIILLHEHNGLPVEIIIMLLQYAKSIGKLNTSYIEKMGETWADEEITTIELAEQKIKSLTEARKAAKTVQKIFGLDDHSPSEKEILFAEKWVVEWKFSTDMLREAYELCVDTKGKYILKYINGILERWHEQQIATVEQIEQAKEEIKKKTPKEGYSASYDLAAYENTSALDEEW